MSRLAQERCEACTAQTPKVSGDEARTLLAELVGDWRIEDGVLLRQFRFRDFATAFTLATRVALIAEAAGHHPDMTVGWGRLGITLTTHAVGGLTRNDFVVAARIDAAEVLAREDPS